MNNVIFLQFSKFWDEKSPKNIWTSTKKVENGQKKDYNQLSGAHSTQKLVKIHNTQVTGYLIKRKIMIRH